MISESDPVEGGSSLYAMTIPGFGDVSWHRTYTAIDRPDHVGADEWFVVGDGGPQGDPTTQTLDFVPVGDGMTRMTMRVHLPAPEDPDEFMEQSAAGLSTSLAVMDELVSD